MNQKELEIQTQLALKESDFGLFQLEVINTKRTNRLEADKLRVSFGAFKMTPQEELFAQFFNSEKELIFSKNMDMLELRAYREMLSKIAFEARARLAAADREVRDRDSKGTKGKGISVSVNTDESSTDAINRIKERTKKLDKGEKLIQSMMKTGMDRATAEHIASARTIKEHQSSKLKSDGFRTEELITAPSKPVVNPFAKKATETQTEVIINEESNTIVIQETVTEEKKETKKNFNPFVKK